MLLGMSGAFKFYHWFSPMVTGASVLSNDSATNMPRSESIMQYTEYCPTSTNLTVKAGWTHNTALLWIRNLIRIVTGNPGDTGWLNGISRPCLLPRGLPRQVHRASSHHSPRRRVSMKSILQFIIFSGLSAAAMADTILPMPGPEAIRSRFDKNITAELKDVISNDFNRCFAPYANLLELFSSSDDPNRRHVIPENHQKTSSNMRLREIFPWCTT